MLLLNVSAGEVLSAILSRVGVHSLHKQPAVTSTAVKVRCRLISCTIGTRELHRRNAPLPSVTSSPLSHQSRPDAIQLCAKVSQ